MEYSLIDYRESDLVRLDIKINGEDAAPLACICHRDQAQNIGRNLVSKLKELIPRQVSPHFNNLVNFRMINLIHIFNW